MIESAGSARCFGDSPRAMAALKKRAPSTWSGTPCACAISATLRMYSRGSGRPIEWAWVFSSATRPLIGSCMSRGSRKASFSSARSQLPSGRSAICLTDVPTTTAWPACSSETMWVVAPAMVSWPRPRWPSWDTRLPIVPLATNSAASLPSSSAARSSRALTVGSSPKTSSPSSASYMALRIAGVGCVTVSLRRSTISPRRSMVMASSIGRPSLWAVAGGSGCPRPGALDGCGLARLDAAGPTLGHARTRLGHVCRHHAILHRRHWARGVAA